MGVPGFYSWLARRYPMILHNLRKGEVPPIDCFYLDMNGIIYKCSKDEGTVFKDLLLQRNIEEIFSLIFNYIDEMVSLVEPKKVLYLFLDGPCPRAKQNQQRSRRFQSAQSWRDLGESLRNCGFLSEGESMKNNSISTGTEFMHELNQQLHFYICKKFQQDPRWENLEVFFSGSNVPGEGEHKIINFMHQYCSSESYDPSTTHCIYGADADLIMLGLSTHIKYVSILREEMKFSPPVSRAAKRERDQITFQMIYLNIVREYMDLEYKMSWKKVKYLTYDIERIIDDFLLICCFIGNDFLPRLYCFNIREGQFEILIQIYKDYLENATEYLNNNGMINWVGLDLLIKKVSEIELEFIGDKASQLISEYKKKLKHRSDENTIEDDEKETKKNKLNSELDEDQDDDDDDDICDDFDESSDEDDRNAATFGAIDANNQFNKELFEKNLEKKEKEEVKVLKKEKQFMEQLQDNYKKDNFLGKSYYYQQKLNLNFESIEDIKTLDRLITKYLEGLQFVLLYYYQGCPSWSWYFPFYYAPMTSDISLFLSYKAQFLNEEIKFDLSQPYPPLKQLMCIIHPENSNLLPAPFAKLLRDSDSPLRSPVDYFPSSFPIDPYGGIFSHEYIVALPFMQQDLIDRVYASIDQEKEFTQIERDRNSFGRNIKYKFNREFPEQRIKSTLPTYYTDFSVRLRIESFDMNKVYSPPKNPTEETRSRFPSLNVKSIINYKIDKAEKGLQMKIKFKEELNIIDFPKFEKPKGKSSASSFFARFPNCEKVYVTGFLTPERFVQTASTPTSSVLKNLGYDPQSHVSFYQGIQDQLSTQYYKKQGLQFNHQSPIIAILKKYTDSTRTLSGFIVENESKFEEYFYPLELLMLEQKIEKSIQVALNNKIQEEFPLGCQVVIAQNGPYDGHTGIVQDYQKGKGVTPTELKVKLLTKPKYLSDVELNDFAKEDENFVSLKYLSGKMKVKEEVLLELLDSVSIRVDPTLPSSSKLPKMLDIGLNVIRRHLNEVVPELARISGGSDQLQGFDKYQQFRYLQLSPSLCKLLVSYYNEHQIIFSAVANQLKTKRKGKDQQGLQCSDIFLQEKQDPNIELVKIYIWIMRQRESQFTSSTVASKVMNSNKIKNLVNLYNSDIRSSIVIAPKDQAIVTIDANNAIPANYGSKQCLFFQGQPFYHEVGDQAIYIGTYNMKNAPFGCQCTVVGILDDKIEVVFMHPFIGGTSLGGRCPPQRGLVVEFLEIYNLQGWNKYLKNRDLSKQREFSWNGWVDVFQPTFREAIKSDNDLKATLNKKGLEHNPFSIISEIKGVFDTETPALTQEPSTKDRYSKVTITNKNNTNSKGGIDTIGKDSLNKDTSMKQQRGQPTAPNVPVYQPVEQVKPKVTIGASEAKQPIQKTQSGPTTTSNNSVIYVRKQKEEQKVEQPQQQSAEPVMISAEDLEKQQLKHPKEGSKIEEKQPQEVQMIDVEELERKAAESKQEKQVEKPQEITIKCAEELEKEQLTSQVQKQEAQAATPSTTTSAKPEKKKALRIGQKKQEFKPSSEESNSSSLQQQQSNQPANFAHFMQYSQYLHLSNIKMQQEQQKKKIQKEEFVSKFSALAQGNQLTDVFQNADLLAQAQTGSQSIEMVDASQLEQQHLQQKHTDGTMNYEEEERNTLLAVLGDEELKNFEELEREYLESLKK